MADVQIEDGFTRFAHALLEALCCADLPSRHLRVVLAIGRLTYGYGRKSDWIGSSQLAKATGIADSHVRLVLRDLIRWNVVFVGGERRGNLRNLGIQKDFDLWQIDRPVRTIHGPEADRQWSGPSTVRKRTASGPDADHARSGLCGNHVGPPTVRKSGPSTVRGSDHLRSDSIDSLPKKERNEEPPVVPHADGGCFALTQPEPKTPTDRARAAWPSVQAAFAAYDPRRKPTSLSAARLRRMAAILREHPGRPNVLVELIHGYMAFHDRHGDGWHPLDNFTPDTCWRASHMAKYLEAHDRALIERGPPPWPPRGRAQNVIRATPASDDQIIAETRRLLKQHREAYQ